MPTSKNRDNWNAYMRKYRKKNKQKLNEYMRNRNRERNKYLKKTVLNHYGWECACCSENHKEFLCIDHINGDGADHRRKIGKGHYYFYTWLIRNNFPEGFQTLCMNCNFAKGTRNYCPVHQKPTR